jgi:hypothetical protein
MVMDMVTDMNTDTDMDREADMDKDRVAYTDVDIETD